MKRKLFFAERMMLGDGQSPFNVVIVARIIGTIHATQISDALIKIQLKHPILNTIITLDEIQFPWFVTSKKKMQINLHVQLRKGEDDWKNETLLQWKKPFDLKDEIPFRIVFIKGDHVSELVICFHHCLCDGSSALHLLQNILLFIDQPNAAFTTEKTILSISDIVPKKMLNSFTNSLKLSLLVNTASVILKLFAIKQNKNKAMAGSPYFIEWALDVETTNELLHTCKKENLTVNNVLTTAWLLAFKQVKNALNISAITCPVNIRKYAPEIKQENIFSFGLVYEIKKAALSKQSFILNSKRIQNIVSKKLSKLNAYKSLMVLEKSHALLQNIIHFLNKPRRKNNCMFSNLGVITIPNQYQHFSVEKIYSPTAIGSLGNPTSILTSTYNGIMHFNFISAEGYLPNQQAAALKEKAMEILKHQFIYLHK